MAPRGATARALTRVRSTSLGRVQAGVALGPTLSGGRPAPDWEPFSIRLTNCRTYVVTEDGQPKRQETVCWGIEIIRNKPPSPVARAAGRASAPRATRRTSR